MQAHGNAQKLVRWLRQHQTVTVAQIAANGVMNSRDASDAVQYGVRHGVLEGSVAVRKARRAEAIYKVLLTKPKSRTAERMSA